jgi:hypothetical protein
VAESEKLLLSDALKAGCHCNCNGHVLWFAFVLYNVYVHCEEAVVI